MGKRRKLSKQSLLNLRRAARDGYLTYRYGSAKPVSLQRVFTGQKRKSMVAKVMDALRDWRLSPFEHEGSARAGVRASLVLEGHGWQRADSEAEALIAEGLHLMGAKRPTWAAGQPEYTIGRDHCANCRGPLDDEAIARRDRFCCEECRTIMRTYRNDRYHYAAAEAAKWAYELTRREGVAERDCGWCGTRFKPVTPHATACSPEHAAKLREAKAGRAIPDRECPGCGNTFHPSARHVKYCSLACHNFHQMKTLPMRTCPACGDEFQPTKSFMKYCSHKCGKKGAAMEAAAKQPEKPCAECGEVFKPKKEKQDFCGRSCASRHRAKKASAFICEEVKEAA